MIFSIAEHFCAMTVNVGYSRNKRYRTQPATASAEAQHLGYGFGLTPGNRFSVIVDWH